MLYAANTGALALGLGLRLRTHRVRSDRSRAPTLKLALVAIVLAGGIGFFGSLQASQARVELTPLVARIAEATPLTVANARATQTRDEQRYTEALRAIHMQLEQSVARVGLGAAFYKSRDIDRRELRNRLSHELDSYREAEARIAALRPPPTMRAPHREYLDTVRLFQQAALEMLRMYEDGDEEHLSAALPFSLDGTQRLQVIRGQVWPNAYPPG